MANKRPALLFYPGDWLRDTALRSCSMEARGLWIDMLCFMHDCTPYGYLKVNHKVILPVNLASMVGVNLEILERLLKELIDVGVCLLDQEGCMYSHRMVKDDDLRTRRGSGGHLGGNPALKKYNKKNKNDQHKDNGKVILEGYPSLANANTIDNTIEIKGLKEIIGNNSNIIVVDDEVNHEDNHKVNLMSDEELFITHYRGNWTLSAPISACLKLFLSEKEFQNDRDKVFQKIKYQLFDLPTEELWDRIENWGIVFNDRIGGETPQRPMRGKDCWPQHFYNWFLLQQITSDPTKLTQKRQSADKTNGSVSKIKVMSGNAPIEEQEAHYKIKKRT